MRASDPPVFYLVGTPKARLKKYEADLLAQPWKNVRDGVDVKLHDEDGELVSTFTRSVSASILASPSPFA